MGSRVCVAAALLLLAGQSACTPFVRRSLSPVGTSSERTEGGGDGGLVGACVQLESSAECLVDYPIPQSLAEIAPAIEKEISGQLIDQALYRSDDCTEAAREIMCAQRFPQCVQEEGEVQFSSLDCEQRLRAVCDPAVVNVLLGTRNFCDLPNVTRPVGDCQSLEELEGEEEAGQGLQHCRQNMQRMVTPWMYDLMLYYDRRFTLIVEDLRSVAPEVCIERQAEFMCQLLGQCSEDGERIEILNTFEACEEFVTCFPDAHADALRNFYDCSHWPREPTTPPPTTATIATSTTPSVRDGWPSPTKQEEVVGSGSSHIRLSLFSLSLFLLLLFL